jgi:hypothetical protein
MRRQRLGGQGFDMAVQIGDEGQQKEVLLFGWEGM